MIDTFSLKNTYLIKSLKRYCHFTKALITIDIVLFATQNVSPNTSYAYLYEYKYIPESMRNRI